MAPVAPVLRVTLQGIAVKSGAHAGLWHRWPEPKHGPIRCYSSVLRKQVWIQHSNSDQHWAKLQLLVAAGIAEIEDLIIYSPPSSTPRLV